MRGTSGTPRHTRQIPLPLLPSGPGGVHGESLHRARSSTHRQEFGPRAQSSTANGHAEENPPLRLVRATDQSTDDLRIVICVREPTFVSPAHYRTAELFSLHQASSRATRHGRCFGFRASGGDRGWCGRCRAIGPRARGYRRTASRTVWMCLLRTSSSGTGRQDSAAEPLADGRCMCPCKSSTSMKSPDSQEGTRQRLRSLAHARCPASHVASARPLLDGSARGFACGRIRYTFSRKMR